MRLLGLLCVSSALLFAPTVARACSPPLPGTPTALPRPGSSDVSIATSIVIIAASPPTDVQLTAGGVAVPTGCQLVPLGSGVDGNTVTSFWRLDVGGGMLVPSAEHVLTAGGVELTRFTTASGYDKQQGTPPSLASLSLWRVRYPLSEIASGDCVFAEYEGFVALDWTPASLPGTTPDNTLYTLQLAPRTGGATQTFLFTGSSAWTGAAPMAPDYLPMAPFVPELDAVREYCASISARGDGDLARGEPRSGLACAGVTEIVKAGAAVADAAAASCPASTSGGACAIAPAHTSRGWGGPLVALVVAAALFGSRRRRR